MRGQSLIFEQVMLFVVGIAIFIVCFTMFRIYEDHFSDMTMRDQLNGVKDFIVSNILRLSKQGEMNSSIILEIPRRINNQPYEVSLSNDGINITTMASNVYVDSGLYNLTESFEFSGKALSSYGKHIIYKKGNKIIIE